MTAREQQGDLFQTDQLDAARAPRTGAQLRRFEDAVAGMPRIGGYNAWLVQVQRPETHRVATQERWRKVGRRIRPGAQRLITLQPFGPVEFLYDVTDTEGPTPPESFHRPFPGEGAVTREGLRRFLLRLGALNVTPDLAAQASAPSVRMVPLPHAEFGPPGQGEVAARPGSTVWWEARLVPGPDPTATFLTLVKALAVVCLGHVRHPAEDDGPTGAAASPGRSAGARREWLSDAGAETEAESVTWLVARRLGLPYTPSQLHERVVHGLEPMPEISLELIARAVNDVENAGGRVEQLGRLLRTPDADADAAGSSGEADSASRRGRLRDRGAGRRGAGAHGADRPAGFQDVPLFEL